MFPRNPASLGTDLDHLLRRKGNPGHTTCSQPLRHRIGGETRSESPVKEGVCATANSQGKVEVIMIKIDAKEPDASQDSSFASVTVRGTGCIRLTR